MKILKYNDNDKNLTMRAVMSIGAAPLSAMWPLEIVMVTVFQTNSVLLLVNPLFGFN